MIAASGNVFTVAMLTLAVSAFCLAILKSQQGNIVGSIGTFYLAVQGAALQEHIFERLSVAKEHEVLS
jgi:hypothetical protein